MVIAKFLNTQTKTVSVASLILMFSYIASALLGLFRDRLLAGRFGAGDELDVYYAAFTIPDFIALILIFGAISAAIIPIFSSYKVKSEKEAWEFLSAFFNIFLVFLIFICLVLIIFAPFFISFIAPGFSQEKRDATVQLMRIMFLSPILLGASNVISGILQVFSRFLATALAPVMYNAGIIIGIVFLTPIFGLRGLALGVVLGGFFHLLIQLPVLFYSGFQYRPNFNIRHPGVLKTLKLMAPRSLGLGANQFNNIVITAIASTLTAGSVAVFNLANNLSSMMVNAFAASLSTAVFPTMSLAYLKEDKKEFEKKFSKVLRQIMFLTVPISVTVFILRAQIVRVILGWGKFGWVDTRLTAACLGIFSVGLFAQGLIFILSKTFYAAHNTKIPAFTSIVSVALNVSMSLVFVGLLNFSGKFFNFMQFILRLEGIGNISVVGLVLAFTITTIFHVIFLLFLLYRKFHLFSIKEILNSLYKILIAGFAMSIVIFYIRQSLVVYNFVALQTSLGVFLQLILSGLAGVIVYILVSHILKSQELKIIKDSFFKGRVS